MVVHDVEPPSVACSKQATACWSSQNVCPIHSLGASSKTLSSRAGVRESPEAKSVTSTPAVDEAVGQQVHDPLDPAIAGRRHREPDRAEERRPAPQCLLPPHGAVLDGDVPDAAQRRHRAELERPAQSGSGAGASLTSVPRATSGRRPSRSAQQEHRRSRGPGLRPGRGRVRDRERRLVTSEAGEHLGQRPVEVRGRLEERPRDRCDASSCRPARARPQAASDVSCGQTVPLW